MAKTKAARQRRKFNYNANRRKLWKKRNKLPAIECQPIKEAWDKRKSVNANMLAMGLSSNPNKTLRIPTAQERMKPALTEAMDVGDKPGPAEKQFVAEELQSIADQPTKKRERISEPMANYCIYMMEKYEKDYKAMARDAKNYYQDTPKQIKKKIEWFKSCKVQYKQYLAKKKGKTDTTDGDVTMS
ncbi:nucleolar protein 16-like isoform X1 [Diadema setosum]|uniref:nucleolar protein 16-like isoform X1 n=1 Tax=Diadema setosum TaxID=31175 RepID=UPI003B3AA25D